MAALPNRVYNAMATQVKRVNDNARELPTDVIELQTLLQREREKYARLEEQNAELRAKLAAYEDQIDSISDAHEHTGIILNGRPAITAKQAAVRMHISVATVNRYCTSGFWDAEQSAGSNRWLVYTDKPLHKKQRS